jgi:Tfp pilus assembly protein PilF
VHSIRLPSVILCAILTGCGNSSPVPKVTTSAASGDVTRNQQIARADTDRAFELLGQSKFDEAEDWLKKALTADPLYGPAHNDMGLIYFHRGGKFNYDAAWEFENAIHLMPRDAPPLNNLGLVYDRTGKLNDAAKWYTAALELEPENTEYAGNDASVRIRLGQRDETTGKLLDLIILRDRRPEWVAWAREQRSRLRTDSPGK